MKLVRLSPLALLVLTPGPSVALRGVGPGTPCSAIRNIESPLGSKFVGDSPSKTSASFFFEGQHLGRQSSIAYTCENGVVVSQSILTDFDDERDAAVFFSDSTRDLRGEFGEPAKDLDGRRMAEIEEELGIPARRFTAWVRGARVISLMLTQEDEERWRVVISGP